MPHNPITTARDSAGDQNPVEVADKQTKIAALRELIGQIEAFPDKRKAMTKARKRRLHTQHHGLCVQCGETVEMFGPTVVYDHEIPLELLGPDEDSNLGPIHASPCNKIKTANDQAAIAKARRLRKADLEPAEPSRLQGRGFQKSDRKFQWPKGRKIESRGFVRGRAAG